MSARDWPGVSVVMPVLNEERHLEASVRRVLDQHYPGDLEVIMAIGPSKDRTPEIAAALAAGDARLRVVDNPAGRTPHALNLAIAAARHDIIVRVDGHGELGDGYIARAVELLELTGAANVGGVMDARGETPFEEAVACVYSTRLGLGGSTFHLESSPAGPADTVFLGAFRKAAIASVGGFDESMLRAQDWELNYRLRQAGQVIWFSPELKVTYRPRSSLKALVRQMYQTGQWRREVVRRHPGTAGRRYLAPPLAVAGIALGMTAGLAGQLVGARWLKLGYLAPLGYAAVVIAGTLSAPRSVSRAARTRLPIVLVATHLSWGTGFLVGLPRKTQHPETDSPRRSA
ncbi:MAG: glycosyltransferase family 2 protein [Propionibacteriaceae bacterium]|nr:glycosyltransferase family 2 protein [Propionibacteriaceae bacterium]